MFRYVFPPPQYSVAALRPKPKYSHRFRFLFNQPAHQEKYTANTFKSARAFRRKLVNHNCLKDWETFFASETDFLDPSLKQEVALNNMNNFATLIDAHFTGQDSEAIGVVLVEACKFCVHISAPPVQSTQRESEREREGVRKRVKQYAASLFCKFA